MGWGFYYIYSPCWCVTACLRDVASVCNFLRWTLGGFRFTSPGFNHPDNACGVQSGSHVDFQPVIVEWELNSHVSLSWDGSFGEHLETRLQEIFHYIDKTFTRSILAIKSARQMRMTRQMSCEYGESKETWNGCNNSEFICFWWTCLRHVLHKLLECKKGTCSKGLRIRETQYANLVLP